MATTTSKWAIISLSYLGESVEDIDEIILQARRTHPDIPLLIPSFSWTEHNTSVRINFLPGYLFAQSTNVDQLQDLVDTSDYLFELLRSGDDVSFITGDEIQQLQENYQSSISREFEAGDQVVVTEGYWKPLEGEIITIDFSRNLAIITVKMEDIERTLDIPLFFLSKT